MDKSEQIKNLELLAKLLEDRDLAYLSHTQAILDLLAPTLLESIVEFFGVHRDQIKWHEIKPHNSSLVLLATVYLDPDSDILDEILDAEVRKVVRIAIPTMLAFESKGVILHWLEGQEILNVDKNVMLDTSEETEDGYMDEDEEQSDDLIEEQVQPASQQRGEFDPASLSKDQIAQLLYFQHHTKGTKQ